MQSLLGSAARGVHFPVSFESITLLRKDSQNFSHEVARLNDVSHLSAFRSSSLLSVDFGCTAASWTLKRPVGVDWGQQLTQSIAEIV